MRPVSCLADIFRSENPSIAAANAYVFQDHATTYAELAKDSNRYANAMISKGIKVNDRIAILDKNSAEFSPILGGTLKARATLVPINFRLSYEEAEFIVSDSGAKILFIGREFKDLADALKKQHPELEIVFLQAATESEPETIPSLQQWSADISDQDPQLNHQPDDHVIQLYTSGTTGKPKGVYHSSEHYMKGFVALGKATQIIADNEVQLISMPLCHIAALLNLLNGLLYGCCQVITREFNPVETLEFIPKYKINTTLFAPVIIQMLVNMPEAENTDFSSLTRIFYGSAPIAQTVLKKAQAVFGCEFWQVYGMTENIGMATFLTPDDHRPERNKLLSCGKPYPCTKLRIVDEEGNDMPTGEVGEIITQADWTMGGYWHRPEASAETLVNDWLYTGDAGYFDDEGYLYIHDRLKDMIVSGGENIYPTEVENALFAHPAVVEAAVFGIPDDKWGEAVKAAVVLKPGHSASEEEIIQFTREKIATFKAPKSIDFIEMLPRNTAGKVLKRQLRAPYWEGRDRAVS